MRRCISIFLYIMLASVVFSGCGKKEDKTDYSYDFSGVGTASEVVAYNESMAASSAEESVSVTYKTWKNNGYSVTVPSTWGVMDNTNDASLFSPTGETEYETRTNTVSVFRYHMEGTLSEDTSEILRSIAIKYMGVDIPKGNIYVLQNFPTWEAELPFKDGGGSTHVRISLVGKQDAIIYVAMMENSVMESCGDEVKKFEDSVVLNAITERPVPQYALTETYPDLWSGIEKITIGDNEYTFPSKLKDMLSYDIKQYETGEPLKADEYRWIRVIIGNGDGTMLVCLHNPTDTDMDTQKCDIAGIDIVKEFIGADVKIDDFDDNDINLDLLCETFGEPVRQDYDLVTWELDGQDLSAAFSEQDGAWTRIAITTLTDAEKEKREREYVEHTNNQKNEADEWLNGNTPVNSFPTL